MKKSSRNDLCPCGSGKKFKKCCASSIHKNSFQAKRITTLNTSQMQKTLGLTSIFHNRLVFPVLKQKMDESVAEASLENTDLEKKPEDLLS